MGLGINTNVSGLGANRYLSMNTRKFGDSLAKLSSGIRVNQAKDGPAALVISELLRSQTSGLERAVRNSQEAYNTLSIAEGGLQQISDQLVQMRGLAIQALNTGVTSPDQVSALQGQLSNSINTIGRIAATTSYSNQNLLNGSQGILFDANDPSNLVNMEGTELTEMPASRTAALDIQFSGDAADQAQKAVLETDFGGGTTLAADQEFILSGEQGARGFSFAAGTSIQDMADAINNVTDSTGVTAYAINGGTELRLASNEYGASQSVKVEQKTGDAFAAAGETAYAAGQNATVTINGQQVEADGLTIDLAQNGFSGTLTLNEGDTANTTVAQTGYDQDVLTEAATAQTASLENLKGGMQLQLGGGASSENRTNVGVQSFDPVNLGRTDINGKSMALSDLVAGAQAALASDPQAALEIIDRAISDVSIARANIGAYQANTLQTNINSLSVAIENTIASESAIRDTDMAKEMTNFVRQQILQKAGLMGVQSSNMNAANVLKLLGG